ncbi:hypothetical protein [Streptomyces sp. NBC_00989]|uniref:hypothetical protein n=1 Tax=Streptomyces sp. NBC_00989 TaxID=2903705 RepID=UPI00386E111B|nr:hypothetical protein OG714_02085 [Streptomyces sp. NBC_00989]
MRRAQGHALLAVLGGAPTVPVTLCLVLVMTFPAAARVHTMLTFAGVARVAVGGS